MGKLDEIADLLMSEDWLKAINVIDSVLVHCFINKAFCHTELQQHEDAIKACDDSIKLDHVLFEAYLLKGRVFIEMNKKREARLVLEQAYQSVRQYANTKQLRELKHLLAVAEGDISAASESSHLVPKNDSTDEASLREWLSIDCLAYIGFAELDEGNHTAAKSIFHQVLLEIERGMAYSVQGKSHRSATEAFAKSESVEESLSLALESAGSGVLRGKAQILCEEPIHSPALVEPGNAHALLQDNDSAMEDYSKAKDLNPEECSSWKARAELHMCSEKFSEAITEFTKVLTSEPNSADILLRRGHANLLYKDFKASVEDYSNYFKLKPDTTDKLAHMLFGTALLRLGEFKEAEVAFKEYARVDPTNVDAWEHLSKFYVSLGNVTEAKDSLRKLLEIDARSAKAYQFFGHLLCGTGEYREAIKQLSIRLSFDGSDVECLYLRGSCHHALGMYKEAMQDYRAVVSLNGGSKFQGLAFHQSVIALYTSSKFHKEFHRFDIDSKSLFFKENWCKMLSSRTKVVMLGQMPLLKDKKQGFSLNEERIALLQAADAIGMKLQFRCPGFLPNKYQHRMAGLAAIEVAQKISEFLKKYKRKIRRMGKINPPTQNRGGAASSSSETSTPSVEEGLMSWVDVYSLAVRWKQISDPCDRVVWVNKLSDEFSSQFPCYTSTVLGQDNRVRNYSNSERALNVAKAVIQEDKYVCGMKDNTIHLTDEGTLKDIINSKSWSDLHKAVGEDFWFCSRCNSTTAGETREGMRMALEKKGDNEFKLGVTRASAASRWDQFNVEMASTWTALCDAFCSERSTLTDEILRMTYYWYNFMPLSRSNDVVGLIVMLGLLLASDMGFTGSIPENLLVDWEAISARRSDTFIDSVKSWLSLETNTSWKNYPDVSSTFKTVGSVIAALGANLEQ